ncbi:MAG TPA: thiamine phosphate synthase [Puia sp.]|jgi:thiamine-phosphate pyrophosphorylase|nr:thiamine phosphate synthase [Puia sp.]
MGEKILGEKGFLLMVITSPKDISGEVEYLEALLEAGVDKLHLRKPEGTVEGLVKRLAPRWASRLVIHGNIGLAMRYGVPQIHGALGLARDAGRLLVSTSVHSWGELKRLPWWITYSFISPLFDSISKRGYAANSELLDIPPGPLACRPVGLGGISADNIGLMIARGWTAAALLGWIWEEPREAVTRFEQIKKIIDGQAKGVGDSGI